MNFLVIRLQPKHKNLDKIYRRHHFQSGELICGLLH